MHEWLHWNTHTHTHMYTHTHTHTDTRANTHTTPLTSLQVAALIFINTIVQTASSLNAKVYLQHDFRLAGFDPRTVENVSSFNPCLSPPALVCHPQLMSVTPIHVCHPQPVSVTPKPYLSLNLVCHPHLCPLCVTPNPCLSPPSSSFVCHSTLCVTRSPLSVTFHS